MERKVGEVFTYKGKIYKVVPGLGICSGCILLIMGQFV